VRPERAACIALEAVIHGTEAGRSDSCLPAQPSTAVEQWQWPSGIRHRLRDRVCGGGGVGKGLVTEVKQTEALVR
jgi:hypothetical protein